MVQREPPPLAARLILMARVHPGNTTMLAAKSWVDLIRPIPGKNVIDFATLTETVGSFYKYMPLSLFVSWFFREHIIVVFNHSVQFYTF